MDIKILDLFSGCGGCALGYHQGFTELGFSPIITGIDINPQPNYPYKFIQCDALRYLSVVNNDDFDLIHASPPCQGYSMTQVLHKKDYPKMIPILRTHFRHRNMKYIIENVEGAKSEMINPVLICGLMVGMPMIRHRLFETNLEIDQPAHPKHILKSTPMGRHHKPNTYYPSPCGNFPQFDLIKEVMALPQAKIKREVAQAIPPAYTRLIVKLISKNFLTK